VDETAFLAATADDSTMFVTWVVDLNLGQLTPNRRATSGQLWCSVL
jgi:hypothetical protein